MQMLVGLYIHGSVKLEKNVSNINHYSAQLN